MDHPLREQTSLLGHTALHSRDFELQWDPQGSRKGVANAPPAHREAKHGGEGVRRDIRVGGCRKSRGGPRCTGVNRAELMGPNSMFPARIGGGGRDGLCQRSIHLLRTKLVETVALFLLLLGRPIQLHRELSVFVMMDLACVL